jgi:hypothetical protein
MCCLRKAFHVAQKMGKGMGGGSLLQRTVQKRAEEIEYILIIY